METVMDFHEVADRFTSKDQDVAGQVREIYESLSPDEKAIYLETRRKFQEAYRATKLYRNAVKENANFIRPFLIQKSLKPDIGVYQIHRSVASPIQRFFLKFKRCIGCGIDQVWNVPYISLIIIVQKKDLIEYRYEGRLI